MGEKKPRASIFSESAEPDLINLKYNVNKKAISCIVGFYKLIPTGRRGNVRYLLIDIMRKGTI